MVVVFQFVGEAAVLCVLSCGFQRRKSVVV